MAEGTAKGGENVARAASLEPLIRLDGACADQRLELGSGGTRRAVDRGAWPVCDEVSVGGPLGRARVEILGLVVRPRRPLLILAAAVRNH